MLQEPEKKDQQALEWARKLHSIVLQANRLRTPFRPDSLTTTWYEQFVKLKAKHSVSQIDQVLDWYSKAIGGEFVPHAFSALAFHDKFDRLLAAMQRDTTIVVSVRARKIAEKMANNLPFPPEVLGKLPEIVEVTRNTWGSFLTRIEVRLGTLNFREQKFLENILAHHSQMFTEEWLQGASDRTKARTSWGSDPLILAFNPSSKVFRESYWGLWSLEYCGDCHAFDKLLDKLLKE